MGDNFKGCIEEIVKVETADASDAMDSKIDSLFLKAFISEESVYFDGHFPKFKLLPAVAQIDLIAHFASKYLGTEANFSEIRRFKFVNKILPNSILTVKIFFDKKKSKINFEILDSEEKSTYSSGICSARKA